MGDRNVDFSFQILIFDSTRPKLLFTNTPKYQFQRNIGFLRCQDCAHAPGAGNAYTQ
jgi:hypothetical protein